MYFSLLALLLTKALLTEVCAALNVTVTPGPVVMVTERDNLTLSCLVSQRKRVTSVLILRWFFSPLTPPPLPSPPPPSPAPSPPPRPAEVLIVRLGMRKVKLYGNYTRGFSPPKFRLYEEEEGEAYRLLVVNVSGGDEGFYTCRVQEVRKHKNIWRASSNGTATTQLAVHISLADSSSEGVWRLFADVYLCAVLICSLGLLSIFMFSLVLTCQYLHNRHRPKASYLLVKCPESSSGETVTSSVSSGSSPRALRKDTRHKPSGKLTPIPIPAPRAPTLPEEPPPYILTKAPTASQRPRKPRRLKSQPRRCVTPRVLQEDSLTYAELELVRPRPAEPPAPTSTSVSVASPASVSSPSPEVAAGGSDTVYAQILFQERQL